MPSRPKTIQQSLKARSLKQQGWSETRIARAVKVSKARVREYLEKNSHPSSCPTCGGIGVNKQWSTGVKTPVCDR